MANLKSKVVKPLNIKFPLKKSTAGAFQTNSVTVDAVADDIRILLLTNFGERPMNYTFGANLRSLLFEPDRDIEQKITDRITAALEKWMPFVTIRNLQVFTNETDASVPYNAVKIKIDFFVGQTDLDGSVVVTARA